MNQIQNPCDKCKKKGNCPRRCYPRMDYERARKRRKKRENRNSMVDVTVGGEDA